jgi:YesN/AraC family two-component response regulator
MEKSRRNLYKILTRWSLSYVALSVVAITIIALCAVQYSRALRENLERTNTVQLEKMQLQTDRNAQNLRSYVNRANLNDTVTLLRKTTSFDQVSRYGMYLLVREMAEEMLYDSGLHDSYLYFPTLDLLVSGNYYDSSKDFYDSYFQSYGFGYEEWYKIISKSYETSQIFALSTGDDGEALVALVKPLSNSSRSYQPANAILIIDLNDMLSDNEWLNQDLDQVCIVDRTNKRIVSNTPLEEEVYDTLMEKSFGEGAERGQYQILVGSSVLSCIPSQYENWDYVAVTQEQEYVARIKELQRLVLLLVLVYLAVSTVVIGHSMMRHFRPLHKMVVMLENQSGEEEQQGRDTYEYISNAVSQLVTKNRENTDVIDRQKNAIGRELLHRLLTEKTAYESMNAELLLQYGINVENRAFCILAYRREEEPAPSGQMAKQEENQDILWFTVQNVTEENLAGEGLNGIFYQENDREGLFLISSDMEGEKLAGAVYRASKVSAEFITRYFRLSHRTAVSEVHSGAAEIHQAYREVKRVFEYQDGEENTEIVNYREINLLPTDTLLQYPIDAENRLSQSIKDGDSRKACEEIRAVLKMNRIESQAQEVAQFLASNIAATMIRIAGKCLPADAFSEAQKELMDACSRKGEGKLQEELERFAVTLCSLVSEQNSRERANQKDRLYTEAKRWVDENYSDPDLSVNSLSNQFHVQPAYLSKLFKEASGGEKLSAYIQTRRLDSAKQLLAEGRKVDDVAVKCGFGSQRTFIRLFKQYEGITPAQFRELVRKQGKEGQKE